MPDLKSALLLYPLELLSHWVPCTCTTLQIRKRELKLQSKIALIKTIQAAMVFGVPPMTALVIFGAYEMNVERL